MARDKHGAELKAGDRVTIECEVRTAPPEGPITVLAPVFGAGVQYVLADPAAVARVADRQ